MSHKKVAAQYECAWPPGQRCNILSVHEDYYQGQKNQLCVIQINGIELWMQIHARLAHCQHFNTNYPPVLIASVWGKIWSARHNIFYSPFLDNPSIHFNETHNEDRWIVFQGVQTTREFIRWIPFEESRNGISILNLFTHHLFCISPLVSLIQEYTKFV